MTIRKNEDRLAQHPPFVLGFLDGYIDRVVGTRALHTKFLVATATFSGAGTLSLYCETPTLSVAHAANPGFWRLLLEFLEGRLPSVMPSALYYELGGHTVWHDIVTSRTPARHARKRAAGTIAEIGMKLGEVPMDVYVLP